MLGTVDEIAEYLGWDKQSVYKNISRTREGTNKGYSCEIYAIEDEYVYIGYLQDKNGEYQEVARGDLKEVADKLGIKENTALTLVYKVRNGEVKNPIRRIVKEKV